MPPLPAELLSLIVAFAPLFSKPVWEHAKQLLLGAILAPGKRTVTACLRVMGLSAEKQFQTYHRVLNRACWSTLQASRILLGLLIALLPPGSTIVIGADDTIERRRGKKINWIGCYRDPVRSTKKHVVKCFGLKWLSLMLLVRRPWSSRVWALPFLTVLCRAQDKDRPLRHKTAIDILTVCVRLVRRWVPERAIVMVVDGGYAALKLALCCADEQTDVTLVTRLRLDVALYHWPGPRPVGKRGRKPRKGQRQRSLKEWAARCDTPWAEVEVEWYGGKKKKLLVFSRTALWHTPGELPVAIRYVLVRDPEGKLRNGSLRLHEAGRAAGTNSQLGRDEMVGRSDFRRGAGAVGYGDAAAMVGESNCTHGASAVELVFAGRAAGWAPGQGRETPDQPGGLV